MENYIEIPFFAIINGCTNVLISHENHSFYDFISERSSSRFQRPQEEKNVRKKVQFIYLFLWCGYSALHTRNLWKNSFTKDSCKTTRGRRDEGFVSRTSLIFRIPLKRSSLLFFLVSIVHPLMQFLDAFFPPSSRSINRTLWITYKKQLAWTSNVVLKSKYWLYSVISVDCWGMVFIQFLEYVR